MRLLMPVRSVAVAVAMSTAVNAAWLKSPVSMSVCKPTRMPRANSIDRSAANVCSHEIFSL